MKKGIWNEIVYRLADRGITEDHAAIYILGNDNGRKTLEWYSLIQLLYDESETRGLDETVDTATIERSYKVQ
ncbi:MAG: hypothetical protein WCL43_04145 [Chlorobium sp.]|jgi:hypothetical protein